MQPSGIDMPSSVLTLLDRQRLLYRAMTNKAPQVADEGTERARPISPRIKQEVDLDPVYSKGSDTRSPASTLLDRKRVLYLTKRNRASQTTVEEEEGPRHKSPRLNDASGSLSIDQRSMPKLRRTGPVDKVPTWQFYVASLALFKAFHGHLEVPRDYIDRNQPGRGNLHLGAWVQSLRSEYRHKQNNPSFRSQLLSDRRIKFLEAMGLEWTPASEYNTLVSSPMEEHPPLREQVLESDQDWMATFQQACNATNPEVFQAWAESEIRRLSVLPRASLQQPHYNGFEANFRMNLVALTLEQLLTRRGRRHRKK